MAIKTTSAAKKSTQKKEQPQHTYDAKVTKARQFDNGISFDMECNGIKIYGCWHRQYEDRKKPGEMTSFISFPSRQGSDGKYYQHCWFPVSDELLDKIEKQIEKILGGEDDEVPFD